jgi:hypothetical protein
MLTKGSFDFIEMKPHEISELVPMIRIFKVLYDEAGDIIKEIEFKFPTRVDRSPGVPPIPFVVENMLNDTTDSGVGIKSFEYKYVGSNPATIRNDIEAKLILYFQNFSEMLRPRYSPDGEKYAYLDLFDRARKLKEEAAKDAPEEAAKDAPPPAVDIASKIINTEGMGLTATDCVQKEVKSRRAYDPVEFEIKAEIGWAWEGSANTLISNEKIEAVKNARQSLFLTLIDHDFTFEDDGTFSLELNYRARLSGVLVSPKCDILGLGKQGGESFYTQKTGKGVTMSGSIADINEEFKRLLKELEACCDADEDIKKLKDEYGKFLDALRGKKFGVLMYNMFNNRSMYTFKIPLEYIKNFADITIKNELLPANQIQAGYTKDPPDGAAKKFTEAAAGMALSGDEWKRQMTEPKTIDSTSAYPMTFFYLGDLIDLVAQQTLSEENLISAGKETLVNPEVAKKIKVVLGTMDMKHPQYPDRSISVSLADIPISYQNWRNFWYKRVISTRRETYSFLHFIRDVVRDLVINVLNSPYYTDNAKVNRQKLQLRTAYVSLPSQDEVGVSDEENQAAVDMLGISGLTTQDVNMAPTNTTDPLEAWMVLNGNFLSDVVYDNYVFLTDILEAKTVDMNAITESSPLSLMNASKSIKGMYHYLIVYVENGAMTHMSKSSIPEKKLRKEYNKEYGIHHFGFGEDRGIFRTATFAKTDQPFLREARYMEDGYNPYQQLSNVYDVNIGLFGAPFFYPGQYVWISPFGLSKSDNINYRLGSPDVGPPQTGHPGGSYAYLMGLGGYHIITEVHGILMDGQYHTNIKARYDNSGADSGQRQGFGFQDEVNRCDEDE